MPPLTRSPVGFVLADLADGLGRLGVDWYLFGAQAATLRGLRRTTVPSLDNTGVNGVYLTSEGRKGSDVWGTRGKWCTLSGVIGGAPVSVGIFDHPSNPGYPTYWHARGYGLFAANPLGQKELSSGKEVLDFAIDAGKSATFRYRVLVVSGSPSAADTEAAWQAWTRR